MLDIDVQGVQSIKATDIQANYVFVTPPSLEVLRSRLAGDIGSRGFGTRKF